MSFVNQLPETLRLAQRAGFGYEGRLRKDRLDLEGRLRNAQVYAIVRQARVSRSVQLVPPVPQFVGRGLAFAPRLSRMRRFTHIQGSIR